MTVLTSASPAFAAAGASMPTSSPASPALASPPSATSIRANRARHSAGRKSARHQTQDLPGLPPAPRGQGDRRRLHSPPATTGMLSAPSGPARPARTSTCEKPASHNICEGRRMVKAARKYQAHGAGRPPEPQHRAQDARHAACSTTAPSARSIWPRASASSAALRSARRPTRPSRPASTGTSSSDPRRCARSIRIASTTTGTGSGTPATATSATRASTRWTSPAGVWARSTHCRNACSLDRRQVRLRRRSGDAQHAARRPSITPTAQLVFEVRGLLTGGEGVHYL